jgi:predicted O-methyltransferase YrrM
MPFQRLSTYLSESRKARRECADGCSTTQLVRFFAAWRRALASDRGPIDVELPWLTFGSIDFLEGHVDRTSRVFEFGSGGSTVFFAARAGAVVSVEHDAAWAQRVERAISAKGWSNSNVRIVPPVDAPQMADCDPADPDLYATADETYRSCSFRDYATAIDQYPDGHFDVVLIDGRARPSCAKHAARKVADGGLLVLDNAERSYYSKVHDQLTAEGWRRRPFYGPGPCAPNFWLTVIWQKVA